MTTISLYIEVDGKRMNQNFTVSTAEPIPVGSLDLIVQGMLVRWGSMISFPLQPMGEEIFDEG